MVIHVQDKDTDWLVRDFARRRGLGITAAIRQAVIEASGKEQNRVNAAKQCLEPIWKDIRAMKSKRSKAQPSQI